MLEEFLILSRGPLCVRQASITGELPSALSEMSIADTNVLLQNHSFSQIAKLFSSVWI